MYQANTANLTLFSKGDKNLIKKLYECKGYNARQFITKVGQRTASARCWRSSEQSTCVGAAADAVRDDNVDTVDLLLLSHEDKPQSHRTVREISREAGDPLIISFVDYSQTSASQVLQEKARSTAD